MKPDARHQQISEIINSVRLLQGISRRQSREFIRHYRITGPQLGALRIVATTPRITLRELSERLYLHTSTVSGIVDRLETRGYIKRERGGEDRRVVHLGVTAEGNRVIKKTPLAGMGLLIHTIHQLPARQLNDIQKGLGQLLDLMKIGFERHT
jgi:DNA-binding MarR family transcriptional regulator